MKLESKFKREFMDDLEELFPGCYLEINSTDFIQGVPDLTMYWGVHWAKFETKRHAKASHRPNQPYYIDKFDSMSFARFVCPENKEEVLRDLENLFKPRRNSRVSKR